MRKWKIRSRAFTASQRDLSVTTLCEIEAVLPPWGTRGIRLSDVWLTSGKPYETVKKALRDLREQGRVVVSGPRAHFLYKLPRRPDGAGAASAAHSSGLSSLNLAAGSPKSPAALSQILNADTLRALVAQGLIDREIGARYGHSDSWAHALRKKYGIPPARPKHSFGGSWPKPAYDAQETFSEDIQSLGGYEDITRAEVHALHLKYPVPPSAPFPRQPPPTWAPSQSSAA